MSLFYLVWSQGGMDHCRKECRVQIHSSFWQALPALLVLSWSVLTACVFSGWSEKEETEWEGGCLAAWQDRGRWGQTGDQLLNAGLLPPLVCASIFTHSNKPSNSYCMQTNQTERMQIPKAGVWVQGMPSEILQPETSLLTPSASFPSLQMVTIYCLCLADLL